MRAIFRLIALAVLTSAAPVAAQAIPASQFATVMQSVAGETLTIEYSRPKARGRQIVGGLIKWDKEWTPGADWATTFETSSDLTVNGEFLPAGKYSVWLIPREGARWSFILSREARVYHVAYPGEENDALRLEVELEETHLMENLTFHFPEVEQRDAVLAYHWGTGRIQLEIHVGGMETDSTGS